MIPTQNIQIDPDSYTRRTLPTINARRTQIGQTPQRSSVGQRKSTLPKTPAAVPTRPFTSSTQTDRYNLHVGTTEPLLQDTRYKRVHHDLDKDLSDRQQHLSVSLHLH